MDWVIDLYIMSNFVPKHTRENSKSAPYLNNLVMVALVKVSPKFIACTLSL